MPFVLALLSLLTSFGWLLTLISSHSHFHASTHPADDDDGVSDTTMRWDEMITALLSFSHAHCRRSAFSQSVQCLVWEISLRGWERSMETKTTTLFFCLSCVHGKLVNYSLNMFLPYSSHSLPWWLIPSPAGLLLSAADVAVGYAGFGLASVSDCWERSQQDGQFVFVSNLNSGDVQAISRLNIILICNARQSSVQAFVREYPRSN